MISLAATAAESHRGSVGQVLSQSLRDIADSPHFASTVEAAKVHLRSGTIIAFDDLAKRASAIASAWQHGHRFNPAAVVHSIENVAAADVRELANELAALPSRHVVHPDTTSREEVAP